ncbi:MAG: NACHT domain-containing protein, partial [Nannocystaceae bacterium]
MSKHRALRNFFEDALSPSELRRLVWDLLGRRALNALPGPDAPPINITDAAVDLLLRRGAIDKALFDLLQTQFPQRANELEHLRTRWLSASPPTNLPAEEFTLRGRAVEFIRLRQVLLSGSRRHAVILGGPGIGKTALALHLAHAPSITDHYDKQYFVRCDKVKSAVACAELVASVLGVSQVTTTPTNDTPQTLLILDNFDTPWEQDQEEAEHLLAQLTANKTLSVVVTMRGASAPGGMPRGHIVRLGPLCVADARKLFLSIVPAHDSWPNLNRLLARVGGVPHAIVLLARASEGNVLELIERDYQHRGTLLLERLGSKPVKSASWSSSINTSLQSCRMTKGAQRLAAVLARIPDGVASEDIEVVTTEPQDVTTLIQVGLAHFKTGRLQMLQPVREHIAQEHELRVGDMSEVMEHYGKLARSLGPKIGQTGGAAALKRLAPERGNLEAALQHAFSCETTDVLRWVKTSYALQNFARFSMHDVQSSFLAAALLSRRNGLRKYELRCLMAAGLNALSCSQFGAAHTHYTSAFARARDLGSTFDQARCISRLGDVSLGQSLLLEARIRYERAHTIHKQAALQVSPAHSLRG